MRKARHASMMFCFALGLWWCCFDLPSFSAIFPEQTDSLAPKCALYCPERQRVRAVMVQAYGGSGGDSDILSNSFSLFQDILYFFRRGFFKAQTVSNLCYPAYAK